MRLKDKVALITGAGRGIGRDIALAYAREGAHVMINDVDPATAEATAKDAVALGSKSLAVVADVAKSTDISRLVDTIIKERGRIDIVVNNAMKIVPGKLEALPEAAWDTTMNIGLKGAFLVSQAAAKHMIAQKSGVIVNIASIAGLFPYNWAGAYSVVKAGLIMLTKLQAMEWAPYGIRANAITPGYIRTPGTEAMYADPEIYEGRRKGVPMGRVGSGEDIAGPAVFLACDESRYTTGSVVGSDGGQAVSYFLTVPGRRFSGGRIDCGGRAECRSTPSLSAQRYDLVRLILFALGIRDLDQALGSFAVFFEEGGEAGWSRRRRDHSMLLKEFNELRLAEQLREFGAHFVNNGLRSATRRGKAPPALAWIAAEPGLGESRHVGEQR